ncbi:MAG: hypothetical protein OCD02_09125 [Spirochaetaceae bacterium]
MENETPGIESIKLLSNIESNVNLNPGIITATIVPRNVPKDEMINSKKGLNDRIFLYEKYVKAETNPATIKFIINI